MNEEQKYITITRATLIELCKEYEQLAYEVETFDYWPEGEKERVEARMDEIDEMLRWAEVVPTLGAELKPESSVKLTPMEFGSEPDWRYTGGLAMRPVPREEGSS